MMEQHEIEALAAFLEQAELDGREVERLTVNRPGLTVEEGYEIQRALVRRKEAAGHHMTGMKMGITSEAKMKQMHIDEPIYGCLFDYMYVFGGGELSTRGLIHPKAEAEIAFILKEPLSGAQVTAQEVLEATDYLVPVMEIIDSRYLNFNFTLPDVVADNCSSSRYVVGGTLTRPRGLDLTTLGASISVNGVLRDQGAGAAVLGHPANAIARLAGMLSQCGGRVEPGQIILSGAITQAFPFRAGDTVITRVEALGEVGFRAV